MAGSNIIYTTGAVTVGGSLLTQETEMSVKRSSGSSPVMTVHLGYAGEAPGAPMVEIEVSNAVPAADFEYDMGSAIEGLIPVEISCYVAGRILTTKGQVHEDTFKHGVGSAGSYSFSFRGPMAGFK